MLAHVGSVEQVPYEPYGVTSDVGVVSGEFLWLPRGHKGSQRCQPLAPLVVMIFTLLPKIGPQPGEDSGIGFGVPSIWPDFKL